MTPLLAPAVAALSLMLLAGAAQAEKRYAPGISDSEITFGQTMPFSGPISAYSQIGRAELAYFRMVNDQGGVNGRKLDLIQLDDGYSPPKTVELTRRLIEEDHVAFLFSSIGTANNLAIRKYLNDRGVPQLWVGSGAHQFDDPVHYPWTLSFLPSYLVEGRVYGRYVLANKPDAKLAVLYQNDDFGKDLAQGFREGLSAQADKRIVASASYEVTDPTIDSQMLTLHGSGADTLFTAVSAKFSSQAIRRAYDLGWKPLYIVDSVGSGVAAALKPAGVEKSVDLISTTSMMDPTDPQWQDDRGMKGWLAWMAKYMPSADLADSLNVAGYTQAMLLVELLKRCGDDLSRENIMWQASHIAPMSLPTFLPGIEISTSPTDYSPVKEMRLVRFDGRSWVVFGAPIDGR